MNWLGRKLGKVKKESICSFGLPLLILVLRAVGRCDDMPMKKLNFVKHVDIQERILIELENGTVIDFWTFQ